jgi:CheY-like chemotaxis protein
MMKLVLEQGGRYDVVCENTSTHALATARACQPDLILMDVVMPEMDGGDVAAQIKADPALKRIPIIFLTALINGKETAGGCVIHDGYQFMGKLASDTELFACIERNLAP